jgi:hypothetical protein
MSESLEEFVGVYIQNTWGFEIWGNTPNGRRILNADGSRPQVTLVIPDDVEYTFSTW